RPQDEAEAWSSIATLHKGNADQPLFCIHSGAAHVFFYRGLATHLGEDATVYALQPKGLDGKEQRHDSIEEMAAFYVSEIKKVQAEGPYTLLGTCFSNAVGLEMAHQLQQAGDEIGQLIFVDSAPAHLLSLRKKEGKRTLYRLGEMLRKGDWQGITKKLRNRSIVASRKIATPFKNEQAQALQYTINNLNDLYARYDWRPFDGEITFIRSSEFAARSDKDFHLEQWTALAKGGLQVYEVPGHHLTLFEEPEVEGLAAVLGKVL
ncbi:MAG: thioesterase domain-containing protein, partial [Bacteroidota bacterium]